MTFDDDDRAFLRKRLTRRGQDLATRLAEIMAGKDGDRIVRALGLGGKPGARPEEILRDALAANEARRRLLDEGDPRFGNCEVCNVELGRDAMREVPWADRCQAHAYVDAPPAH